MSLRAADPRCRSISAAGPRCRPSPSSLRGGRAGSAATRGPRSEGLWVGVDDADQNLADHAGHLPGPAAGRRGAPRPPCGCRATAVSRRSTRARRARAARRSTAAREVAGDGLPRGQPHGLAALQVTVGQARVVGGPRSRPPGDLGAPVAAVGQPVGSDDRRREVVADAGVALGRQQVARQGVKNSRTASSSQTGALATSTTTSAPTTTSASR
jgi:hypothetical protein